MATENYDSDLTENYYSDTTKDHGLEIVPLDRNHFYEMIKTGFNEGLFESTARKEDEQIIFSHDNQIPLEKFRDPLDRAPFTEFVISEHDNTITVRELNADLVMEDKYIYNLVTCEISFMPNIGKNDIAYTWFPCQLKYWNDECEYAMITREPYVHPYDDYSDLQKISFTMFNGVCKWQYEDAIGFPVILSDIFTNSELLPPK